MGLGFVVKILDGGLDLCPAIVADPFFVVQDPGNCSYGDSRSLGDILNGGHGDILLRSKSVNWY